MVEKCKTTFCVDTGFSHRLYEDKLLKKHQFLPALHFCPQTRHRLLQRFKKYVLTYSETIYITFAAEAAAHRQHPSTVSTSSSNMVHTSSLLAVISGY